MMGKVKITQSSLQKQEILSKGWFASFFLICTLWPDGEPVYGKKFIGFMLI